MQHSHKKTALTLADECLLRRLGSNDAVELLQHVFEVVLRRFNLPTHRLHQSKHPKKANLYFINISIISNSVGQTSHRGAGSSFISTFSVPTGNTNPYH